MTWSRAAVLALAGVWISLGLVSCGGDDPEPDGDFEVLRSLESRNLSPNSSAADLAAQVDGNTDLALDLHRYQAERTPGNLFFSPHIISTALAMTWAGARGQTEREMAETLHYVLPQERLHPVFNALDLALESRAEGGGQGSDGKGFRLRVANSNWVQKDYPILTTFLDVLAESYGAGLYVVDFAGDTEGARQTINAWVEEQTEDRIKELLPPGSLDPLTRLALVNAVYFNAAWAKPFDPALTRDRAFHLSDGNDISIPTMHQRMRTQYAADEGWQAVELAYEGNELGMLIIVPDSGRLAELESGLDAAGLGRIVSGLQEADVQLAMPLWTVEGATFSLKQALSDLGMPTAFSGSADFSGIDGTRNLLIQDVVHQAFVKVDEAGTEAAAATAVLPGLTSFPTLSVVVEIDRPFLYLIRDRPTGAVLFLGRMMDPRAK